MMVKFARNPSILGGASSSGKYLSPYSLEEGGALPSSPSKRSFLDYYYQLDLEQYRSDGRRGSSGGCVSCRPVPCMVGFSVVVCVSVMLLLYNYVCLDFSYV